MTNDDKREQESLTFLRDHPELMASLIRGMTEAAAGEVQSLGSFAQYLNDETLDGN